MPFTYRDKPKLAERLRGKSGEEILNELKSDLDSQGRRMFFDSPSWRTRQSNSSFPRGFPFDDDRNRINIRTYLDEIAARHPEFADQLVDRPWTQEFAEQAHNNPGQEPRSDQGNEPSGSGQQQPEETEPPQGLNNFGLRNTVPLGPGANPEENRQQRSMSAPPDNRGKNKAKRFVTKCEIPVMNNQQEPVKSDMMGRGPQEAQQKGNNGPNVRVIPIQVEGRDAPLVNTNIDFGSNFGGESYTEPSFEGRLPRDFGSYQRHSPRFAHKERAPTPPQYQYAPQYQQYVPPSQHFMPQQQYAPQQHFVPPEHQAYAHQQQHPQKPPAPPPQQQQYPQPPPPQQHHQQQQQHPKHKKQQQHHPQQQHHQQQQQQHHPQQQQKQHQQQKQQQQPHPQQHQQQQHHPQQQQQQQQQRQGNKHPQADEIDSRPPPPPKPEPIKDPIEKVQAIQKEVEELMKQVEAFNGNSRTDKQYLTLDELLTRQLLLLDVIDTEGKENVRQARKETIRNIQRCISTLENKVPVVENNETAGDGSQGDQSNEAGAPQPMNVDTTKENTPVENKDSQNMEVDDQGSTEVQQQQQQAQPQQPEQQQEVAKQDSAGK